MSDHASDTAGWIGWLAELCSNPHEYHFIIRVMCSFFITLALAPIVPIAGLIVYDLTLWFWRLAAANWRARGTPAAIDLAADLPKPLDGAASLNASRQARPAADLLGSIPLNG
ncbi:hypothetical protein C8A05DRAFT_15391 [Staphylotrichum tortipilum]|uniref:Uncharacterized protein n=1 Tax=Staphylotrichum tortipilum TaxID=2831512 RepID=A0AAN6RTU6_9PEZI|nr:hypothetical protein C8A05DRAFT_15391 [Staphylotrichum longicolle]